MPTSKRSRAGHSPSTHANLALTGTTGFLGSLLLKTLEQDARIKKIVAVDKAPLPFPCKKTVWEQADLTKAGVEQKLARLFEKHGVETLLHTALPSRASTDTEAMHETQTLGSLHLLTAAAGAGVTRLILASTTDVYGAFPDNPNFLEETHPPRGDRLSEFLKDKIEVENQFLKYQKEHPEAAVALLRPATILGPTVNNFKTTFLQHPVIPTVLGFDPLIQFVHEADVLRAFLKVIRDRVRGVYNIVAKGVLPLSKAIRTLGRIPFPLPTFLLYPSAELLWMMNLGSVPGSHVNFLKYLCVADGAKAWKELRFKPVYSTQEALMSFTGKNLDPRTTASRLEDLEGERP